MHASRCSFSVRMTSRQHQQRNTRNQRIVRKRNTLHKLQNSSTPRRRIMSNSELVIRMVLPAEQTVAIAESMLKRQSEPTDTGSIVDSDIQRVSKRSAKKKRRLSERKTAEYSVKPSLQKTFTVGAPKEHSQDLQRDIFQIGPTTGS